MEANPTPPPSPEAMAAAEAAFEQYERSPRSDTSWMDSFRSIVARALDAHTAALREEISRLQLQGHSLFGKGQEALSEEMTALRERRDQGARLYRIVWVWG